MPRGKTHHTLAWIYSTRNACANIHIHAIETRGASRLNKFGHSHNGIFEDLQFLSINPLVSDKYAQVSKNRTQKQQAAIKFPQATISDHHPCCGDPSYRAEDTGS